jgi:predicted flap endonuclease-1-like 5' DNA nuclease
MMSKILSPKAWYLVGIGAAAVAFDATRRLLKRRRQPVESVEVGEARPAPETGPVGIDAEPVAATPMPVESDMLEAPLLPGELEVVDLTQIKGIGPTYARRLVDAGYRSYGDIAGASPDTLREITKAPPMANIDEWIAQARELG